MFAGWHPSVEACIHATDEQEIRQDDIVDRVPTRGWGRGRVVLLGDAIHPTTPSLVQGNGLAVESAAVLARALECSSSPEKAFAKYEGVRFPRTSSLNKESWNLDQVAVWESPLVQKLFSTALAMGSKYAPSLVESRTRRMFADDIYGNLNRQSEKTTIPREERGR